MKFNKLQLLALCALVSTQLMHAVEERAETTDLRTESQNASRDKAISKESDEHMKDYMRRGDTAINEMRTKLTEGLNRRNDIAPQKLGRFESTWNFKRNMKNKVVETLTEKLLSDPTFDISSSDVFTKEELAKIKALKPEDQRDILDAYRKHMEEKFRDSLNSMKKEFKAKDKQSTSDEKDAIKDMDNASRQIDIQKSRFIKRFDIGKQLDRTSYTDDEFTEAINTQKNKLEAIIEQEKKDGTYSRFFKSDAEKQLKDLNDIESKFGTAKTKFENALSKRVKANNELSKSKALYNRRITGEQSTFEKTLRDRLTQLTNNIGTVITTSTRTARQQLAEQLRLTSPSRDLNDTFAAII